MTFEVLFLFLLLVETYLVPRVLCRYEHAYITYVGMHRGDVGKHHVTYLHSMQCNIPSKEQQMSM